MKPDSLKELIEKCRWKYIKSIAPGAIGGIVGWGSLNALAEGYYPVATIEGLISAGLIFYSVKKMNKYADYEDELINKYLSKEKEKKM